MCVLPLISSHGSGRSLPRAGIAAVGRAPLQPAHIQLMSLAFLPWTLCSSSSARKPFIALT